MRPTFLIAAGTALLGAFVMHQGGYLSKPVVLPDAGQPAGAQAQPDDSSKPAAVAQGSQPSGADAPAPTPPPASSSQNVDETALRYFAAKGDTKRLNAEIARLKALYPDWTPPA
ncbi:MAG: cellulose synthase, partial [Pseudomonadota bacterium]